MKSPIPQPDPTAPLIELRAVCKEFTEGHTVRRVLRDADLTIGEGELVVILGRSGSGKSTLLNLVAGIDQPSSGRIVVAGIDLVSLDEHRRTLFRRHHIGFIFQFFNLIPTLTVEENLLLPLELSGRLSTERRRHALARLDTVGLGDRGESYPDVLSGGEQQRVAIARALAHDPLLLLADEPTGNLDEETAGQVLDLLLEALRGSGKTMVMATHSRDVAARADRVLRVVDGRLVEQETPA